jgi:hypothetical protein
MKFLSTLRNRLRKSSINNQLGQGATEYILLLVVVVGLVMAFKKPITEKFLGTVDKVGTKMDDVVNN